MKDDLKVFEEWVHWRRRWLWHIATHPRFECQGWIWYGATGKKVSWARCMRSRELSLARRETLSLCWWNPNVKSRTHKMKFKEWQPTRHNNIGTPRLLKTISKLRKNAWHMRRKAWCLMHLMLRMRMMMMALQTLQLLHQGSQWLNNCPHWICSQTYSTRSWCAKENKRKYKADDASPASRQPEKRTWKDATQYQQPPPLLP